MQGDPDEVGENIARLEGVVFDYERGVKLPDADSLGQEADYDPDDRTGPVLRGVDLSVPDDSFTVVMGASGGGKSTLLRTFNAIVPNFIRGSFAGDVTVLGRETTAARVPEMAAGVGMVLQDYEAQLFGTSVRSEVAFGPENLRVAPADIGPRIEHALGVVGLDDLDRRRSPGELSGGQKQRLVFAGVVANQPDLLVLDEPTSDLDPAGSRDVVTVVRRLAEGSGGDEEGAWSGPDTIVMVTHKIEQALLADHAVLLRAGRVYRQGPLREVFTDVDALREARVALPPVVDVFDRLGWPHERLPLTPAEAAERVKESDLEWTPPATREGDLPGVPARTGEDPGESVFELDGVVHEYATDRGSIRAVDGVSLTVRDGEMVAIVGHNGSGKTTLAKHFNGLLAPDEGTARWRGRTIADLSMAAVGRSVGYVFQNPDHQIFAATVREEVAFGPENFGLAGEELDRAVAAAIETVELDGLEDADPFNLSKGQRQRVALASILATDPEVIVFDEPTTGLDATQQRRFMDLVARLNREEGLTVLMVTHGMRTVTRYAPRTIVMADGRVAADLRTRELFADEERLAEWELTPPQPVALSNRLADASERADALPALSVEEVVEGLGGPCAAESGADTEAVGDGGGDEGGGGDNSNGGGEA